MLDKILHNQNVHYVKFMRGSTAAWEALKRTPSKISDDTLYFIYDTIEKPLEGKLYLGRKLISGKFDAGDIGGINKLDDVDINGDTLVNGDLLQWDDLTQMWTNAAMVKGQAVTNISPIIFPVFANDGEVLVLTEGEQPEVEKQDVVFHITSVSVQPTPEPEPEPEPDPPLTITTTLTII